MDGEMDILLGDGHVHVPFHDNAFEQTIDCAFRTGLDFVVIAERDVPWKDNKNHYELFLESNGKGRSKLDNRYDVKVLEDKNYMIKVARNDRSMYVIRGEEIKTKYWGQVIDILAWGIGARIDAKEGSRWKTLTDLVKGIHSQDATVVLTGVNRILKAHKQNGLVNPSALLRMFEGPIFCEYNNAPGFLTYRTNRLVMKEMGFPLVGGSDAHTPIAARPSMEIYVTDEQKRDFHKQTHGQAVLRMINQFVYDRQAEVIRDPANPVVFALQYCYYTASHMQARSAQKSR